MLLDMIMMIVMTLRMLRIQVTTERSWPIGPSLSRRKRPPLSKRKRKRDREHRPGEQQDQSPVANYHLTLSTIQPANANQKKAFEEFRAGQNLLLHGHAGTGKTFLAIYLSLESILNHRQYNRLYIVRSAVPTRNQGFLPGNLREKAAIYELPYQSICNELFGRGDAYDILKKKDFIEFFSTSYIRGLTLQDCIVIIDEVQNLSDQEINSIITRIGNNCMVIMSGDFRQSDLNSSERQGVMRLLETVKQMPSVSHVEFGLDDIVRSGFVREFLIARDNLGF